MNYQEYQQLKATKDNLSVRLDTLAKKYNSDQLTIDCTKMTEQDYNLYIAIDSELEKTKETMSNYYGLV